MGEKRVQSRGNKRTMQASKMVRRLESRWRGVLPTEEQHGLKDGVIGQNLKEGGMEMILSKNARDFVEGNEVAKKVNKKRFGVDSALEKEGALLEGKESDWAENGGEGCWNHLATGLINCQKTERTNGKSRKLLSMRRSRCRTSVPQNGGHGKKRVQGGSKGRVTTPTKPSLKAH